MKPDEIQRAFADAGAAIAKAGASRVDVETTGKLLAALSEGQGVLMPNQLANHIRDLSAPKRIVPTPEEISGARELMLKGYGGDVPTPEEVERRLARAIEAMSATTREAAKKALADSLTLDTSKWDRSKRVRPPPPNPNVRITRDSLGNISAVEPLPRRKPKPPTPLRTYSDRIKAGKDPTVKLEKVRRWPGWICSALKWGVTIAASGAVGWLLKFVGEGP